MRHFFNPHYFKYYFNKRFNNMYNCMQFLFTEVSLPIHKAITLFCDFLKVLWKLQM